ncbi:S24 family peptidase [Nitrosomonas sp. Nm132]|jgi:hypothetical protein|uniref:S24 family peptidase n=1 Tax=Nitrosomonas sp. Nm132 TaxID=1881053 RepID=UPI000891E41E|nr:S24 family peptidase [Nitrosomonas sp. Nm132]SDH25824.1 Peptidase S24-like [Nitrosomonas sp. Nm132]
MKITDIRRANLKDLVDMESLSAVSKKAGKPDRQINDMIAGRKSFGEKIAREIEENYASHLPTGWLDKENYVKEFFKSHKSSAIYDQEPVISSKMTSEKEHTNASAFFHILDVKAACGEGHFNNDYHEIVRSIEMEPNEAQHLIGSMNRNNKIQIVIASKDSMAPTIQPDDLLFVDMSIKDYAGEAIYILLHGGELICKRLSIVGKTLMVSSDNKFYQSWPWDDRMEGTRIIGRVIRALPMTFKKFGSV